MGGAVNPPVWGQWHLVILSILMHLAVFVLFIAGTRFRGKARGGVAHGAFLSFIVALYFEMYGIPLTIYILGATLGFSPPLVYPPPLVMRLAGGMITLGGFLLVYFGWKEIYRARGALVTTGVYRHLRHPQYLGLWLLTLGLLVQWPTLVALVLWPLVFVLYYRLALAEECDVQARFPESYAHYAAAVPRFFPRLAPVARKGPGNPSA